MIADRMSAFVPASPQRGVRGPTDISVGLSESIKSAREPGGFRRLPPLFGHFNSNRLIAISAMPPAMQARTSWLCPYRWAVGSSSSIEM